MLNPNTQAGGLQRMYKRVKVVREVKILWPRKELFSELTRTLGLAMLLHMYFSISASAGLTYLKAEVNISPKISISAQPLKMALHKNPAMHGSRIAIFLHEDKKEVFLHDYKLFFCTIQK